MPADLTTNLTDEQKIAMNIITLNTAVNDLQNEMKIMNKVVLVGNGELPLREVVRNHDKFIMDIKYWTRFIGGALVLQTLAFAGGIIIAVVKFLPILERLAKP
jgi:hypothetical protein